MWFLDVRTKEEGTGSRLIPVYTIEVGWLDNHV